MFLVELNTTLTSDNCTNVLLILPIRLFVLVLQLRGCASSSGREQSRTTHSDANYGEKLEWVAGRSIKRAVHPPQASFSLYHQFLIAHELVTILHMLFQVSCVF